MAHPSDEVLIYFFRLLDSGFRLFSDERKSLSLDSECFASLRLDVRFFEIGHWLFAKRLPRRRKVDRRFC